MKRLFVFAIATVTTCSMLTGASAQIADENADGLDDRRARHHRLNLTTEQREQIKATVTELKENDATRVEIATAVGEKLQTMEVELPENFAERQAERLEHAAVRDQLHEKIDELKESGATQEEIKAEVDAFKEANGIEATKGRGRGKGPGRGHRGSRGQH